MRASEGGVRIRRAEFDRILQAVRDTGVHIEVERMLRPLGNVGRPRRLAADVFLAACIATALHGDGLVLKDVHYLLTEGLAHSQAVALNVKGKQGIITVRQVRYMLEAIEKRLAYTEGRAPDLDDVDRETRSAALQRIVNLLVEGTLPLHLDAPTSFALDATGIDSWAHGRGKGRKRVDPASDHAADGDYATVDAAEDGVGVEGRQWPDPDAEWGYRTRTATNPTNSVHGFHMLAMVGVPGVGECPDVRPKLIHTLTLIPANSNAVSAAVSMLDAYLETGAKVSEILNDREFSYKVPTAWATPLRARGIRQVSDMHDGDRGPRDYNGIVFLDGAPHCPSTPEHLHKITRPANLSAGDLKVGASMTERTEHSSRVKAVETFRALIAERRRYAFVRNAGPDESGKEQFICPARAGKLKCTHCPLSRDFPDDVPELESPPALLPLPEPPRALPPTGVTKGAKAAFAKAKKEHKRQADQLRCCRQATIVIPGDVCAKNRQDLYWGSDEWIASYSRRTHAEGAFGQFVGPAGTGVRRGWTRVMGVVKTALMVACGVVATNINALRAWADRTEDFAHPLSSQLPESAGWEEIDSGSEPGSPHAPPTAA